MRWTELEQLGVGTVARVVSRFVVAGLATALAMVLSGCGGGGGGGGVTVPKGSVTGLVVNIDGQGVGGARVTVAGTGLVTATDGAGKYRLDGVPAGWQTIEVVKSGMVSAMTMAITADGRLVTRGRQPVDAATPSNSAATKYPAATTLPLRHDILNGLVRLTAGRVQPMANDVVGRTRVAVIADAVVRAPDVILTDKSSNVDWIAVAELTPAPGQTLSSGTIVTITTRVQYRLASSETGKITLFLVDEFGLDPVNPASNPAISIPAGEGEVVLRQTVTIPNGVALIQPVLALFSGDDTLTYIWTYPPAYPVTVFTYKDPLGTITNLVTHPERNEVYVAADLPDGHDDKLVIINMDTGRITSLATVHDPLAMAISDDGKTVYMASRSLPELSIYETDTGITRAISVKHGNITSIAPIADHIVAYAFDIGYGNAGSLLNIATGTETPWLDDIAYQTEIAGSVRSRTVFAARDGRLEKWRYDNLQGSLILVQQGPWMPYTEGRILVDRLSGNLFYGGYKISGDNLGNIIAYTPVESRRFIALAPNGRWLLGKDTTVYETEGLFPVVSFGVSTDFGGFTPDGLVWLASGGGIVARRIPGWEVK
ncbi:MAG: carboxypeptidase regulatory-like domain-containing protein [Limnochordales bacterium]|nr:carboxypeptidase regulatory-like domain-containing protein [Limnochordales bacterium]